ncbi:MAG: collagen-like triple helix repeat-containing protein [Alcanivorax sp.]
MADNTQIAVYRATLATPEDLPSLRFWVQNELTRIQLGFTSADEVIRAIQTTLEEIISEGNLQGPPGEDGQDGAAGAPGQPGRDGTDGTDGQDATAADLIDDNRAITQKTWSSKKIQDELNTLAKKSELNGLVRWMGNWQNITYNPSEQVVDAGWLMVSNKQTNDRAAPQPDGEPFWYADSPAWATLTDTAATLYSGQRYTFAEGLWITSLVYEAPVADPDVTYELWLVTNPLTSPGYEQVMSERDVAATGTQTFPIPQRIVVAGEVLDLVLVTHDRSGSVVSAFDWDYQTPNNSAAPGTGAIIHAGKSQGELLIHKTDDGGTDRSAVLATVKAGDTIAAGGFMWDVVSAADSGAYHTFAIQPQVQATAGVLTVTFTVYGAAVISYEKVAAHFNGSAEVQGLYSNANYGSIVLDDAAYGVDIEVQPAYVSPDWDFQAYSDGS